MLSDRWVRVLGGLCLLGSLGAGTAAGLSLADLAKKEKERREKAGATGAPAFSNEDLRKLPDSAEANPNRSSDDGSRTSRTSRPTDDEGQSEAWWRSRANDGREEIAEAEQAVKHHEALVEEARTGIRQPQPGDATRQLPPRVASDTERRAAQLGLSLSKQRLAQAKKAMDELEEEARKKQILPGWLR